MMFGQFNNLFATVDDNKNDGGLSVEDTIEFLKDDDSDKKEVIDLKEPKKDDKEKEEEGKEEEKEESDELKAIEEELEEPTDEQLELVTPVRRQEILKLYPKLFKD